MLILGIAVTLEASINRLGNRRPTKTAINACYPFTVRIEMRINVVHSLSIPIAARRQDRTSITLLLVVARRRQFSNFKRANLRAILWITILSISNHAIVDYDNSAGWSGDVGVTFYNGTLRMFN